MRRAPSSYARTEQRFSAEVTAAMRKMPPPEDDREPGYLVPIRAPRRGSDLRRGMRCIDRILDTRVHDAAGQPVSGGWITIWTSPAGDTLEGHHWHPPGAGGAVRTNWYLVASHGDATRLLALPAGATVGSYTMAKKKTATTTTAAATTTATTTAKPAKGNPAPGRAKAFGEHTVSRLILWMGREGMTLEQATHVVAALNLEASPKTLATRVREGAAGLTYHGVPAELTPGQAAEVRLLAAQVEPPLKPVKRAAKGKRAAKAEPPAPLSSAEVITRMLADDETARLRPAGDGFELTAETGDPLAFAADQVQPLIDGGALAMRGRGRNRHLTLVSATA